jgi:diadenylate cyclase
VSPQPATPDPLPAAVSATPQAPGPAPARPGAAAALALIGQGCQLVDDVGAEALLIIAEGPMDWAAIRQRAGGRRVLVVASSQRQHEAAEDAGLVGLALEAADAPPIERISLALMQAVADDRLSPEAKVVVAYAGFEPDLLDTLSVVDLGEHLGRFTARDLRALETSVPLETLRAVVELAVEIGREGREGKPVGTLIVVGDARDVLARSRTLGFDPFKGYRRKERNVRDSRVREAIKEIAQLDGGFVISRDGTVEAACRIIDAPTKGLALPKGLGTRHWAAAAITQATSAVAVVVSQSTGAVRIFQGGEVVLRVAPTRRARALKWQDAEPEP